MRPNEVQANPVQPKLTQTNLGPRIVVALILGAAYVLGTHWLMTRAHESPWNVVGVLTPMLAAIAIGCWRSGQRWLGAVAAIAVVALCAQALLGINVPSQVLYLAQHAGINLFLAVAFGSTLRAGHTALITILASRVHRHMPPPMVAYTRNVTLAWAIYFVAIATVSVVVFVTASFETWALFSNLLSPISVGVMFAGEYLLRYRLHPEFERTTIADAIRSWMHGTSPKSPSDTA